MLILKAKHSRVLREWGGAVVEFIKQNTVLVIAFVAAAVTCMLVPIEKGYLEYFDYKTLSCLFCVLAVVCALKNISFFYVLAQKIVSVFKNLRLCVLSLVYITFIGSMFIANDMALLTFLPLGFFVLQTTEQTKYMAFTFIMQNIAANLGGMLTPFGNPQNLYLYTKFNIPNLEFMQIMFLPFLIAVLLITLCCIVFVKAEPLNIEKQKVELPPVRTIIYFVLFGLSIAIVFRSIPYVIGLIVIPVVLLFADKNALKQVDYPLLLTFVFFFIFSGNMARIDVVRQILSFLLEKNTLIFSVLSCQVISNVPSAILLSQFTENYRDLLIGVNIGGTGTLIASLASLITFREYSSHNKGKTMHYIKWFLAFNFGFLIILTVVMWLVS